jgi:hypothetical protein
MGDATERLSKARVITERPESHFGARQVHFQESPGGLRTQQDYGVETTGA